MRQMNSPAAATLIGLCGVLMWSLFTVLTVATGRVPPFQLAAMTFAIGGALGAATWLVRPGGLAALKQPPEIWALGVSGLFGFHALYFLALRLAPPAEAQLVNYAWPLLIVVLSAFLPNERLKAHHVGGVLLGIAGLVVLFGRDEVALRPEFLPGYMASLMAAVVWAVYSVVSRRLPAVPTDTVAGFCLATALLSLACHIAFETTVWPAGNGQWLAVLVLGMGPVGAAFYAWDHAIKHGDIRVLGVGAWAAPLLSTCYLVLAGHAEASRMLALAALLIAGGGVLSALDMFRKPETTA